MSTPSWPDLRTWTVDRLGSLRDGEWVRLGEPVPEPPPRRFLRRPEPPPVRYVQAVNTMGEVQGECVGPTSLGGAWEVTPEQHDRLVGAGWLPPDQVDRFRNPMACYCFDAAVDDADRLGRLAGLMVEALEVLGLDVAGTERATGP